MEEIYKIENSNKRFLQKETKGGSIWFLMLRTMKHKTFFISIMLLDSVFTFGTIYLLKILTETIEENSDQKQTTPLDFLLPVFGGLYAINFARSYNQSYAYYFLHNELILLKNNFILKVMEKVKKIQSRSAGKNFRGNATNLILIDCEKIGYQGSILIEILLVSFLLLTTFTISFVIFGWTFIFYIVIAFLFSVFSAYLYNKNRIFQHRILGLRDKRVTFLDNIFKNIRFVKFNVLENFFAKHIHDMKKVELRELSKYYVLLGFIIFINWICPGVAITGLFMSYFYFYSTMSIGFYLAFNRVVLEVEMVFRWIPYIFQAIVDFKVSFDRLSAFMSIDENEFDYEHFDGSRGVDIKVQNGRFWYDNSSINKFNQEMSKKNKKSKE